MPPCDADPASRAGADALPPGRHDRPTPPQPVPDVATLSVALPAELGAAWLVRNRIRAWLDSWSWPAAMIDDVEYATSEAVSNVAEHAYGGAAARGTVEVDAAIEHRPDGSRRLRIRVRDHGRWQTIDPDPAHRGRGIYMMRTLMDEVTIRRGDGPDADGTEVVLLSPVAPPHPDPR